MAAGRGREESKREQEGDDLCVAVALARRAHEGGRPVGVAGVHVGAELEAARSRANRDGSFMDA